MKKSIFLFFAAILCAFSMNVQAADLKGDEVVLLKPGTNWKKDGARFAVYFFNNSTSKNQWVSMKAVEGETDLYYAIAPTGTWKNLIYARMNPGNSANSWDTKWNQSADLTWSNTNSLFTVADGTWDGATTTWSAKKVASTGKLTASSANVSENEAVTLTPSLTTNTAINTIQSTTYTISPSTGASVSGNTFTATTAGTYTVTATIKYRLNGYTSTSFESTVDATTTITVASAAEPKHDVKVTWMSGTKELQSSQTLSVGESTGYPVEAPEFKDYTFSGWTLGSGVQSADENANPISITTKASGEYTLVANYDYIEPVIKTIYCKMEYDWWTQASAAISAYISGTYGESTGVGSLMTLAPLEGNVWKIDVDVARYQKIRFIRVNPEGTSDWGARTGLVEIPTDDKNLYTITQSTAKWSGDCPGTWSVYEAPATAPKRYITGTKELVGGEGWKANEIEMSYDNGTSTYSHTFLASTLTAGTEYKLKVTEGNWDGGKWGTINGTIPGVSNDGDGNVCFTLKTAGDVTITFDGSKITVSTTGEFKVPVVYPYYILGTMNSWSVKEEYGLADEDEDGVYTREITLAAGEHFFKINNGTWDSQWGWSNVVGAYTEATDASDENKIKITLASEKTFVVEFNKSKNQITFDGLTEKTVVKYDYYLIGTINGWTTKDENFGMTDENADGVYEKEVTLAIGTHDLKVNNGTWDDGCHWGFGDLSVNYEGVEEGKNGEGNPNGNIKITLAAEQTITVKFGKNTKKITLDGLTEKAPAEPAKCYLMGIGGDWTTGIEMEEDGDQFKLLCQPIAEGEQFKFKHGDTWSDGVQNYDFPGIKWVDDDNDGNSNITLPAGNYNFYYKKETNQVYIEAATDCETEIRTGLTVGQWGTLCPKQNVANPTGATFYQITYLEEKDGMPYNMYFDQIKETTLTAGQPYFFIASETEIKGVKWGEPKTEGSKVNGFCGYIDDADAPWELPFEAEYGADKDNTYVIYNNCVFRINATTYIKSERCYIIINKDLPSRTSESAHVGAHRISMSVAGQNTATGVDQVQGDNVPTKMIINGQLFILRGEKMYDAQGKLVK